MDSHDITLVRQVFHLYVLFALLALPNAVQAHGDAGTNTPAHAALFAACADGIGTGRDIYSSIPEVLPASSPR